MDALINITLNSGDERISPCSEGSDGTIAMLKPVVAAGGGELAGLHITMEAATCLSSAGRPTRPPYAATWRKNQIPRSGNRRKAGRHHHATQPRTVATELR